jgi:hypothetical protein
VFGAALQQAVGEAAGRRADVQATAPRRIEAERRQRVGELQPATRDETRTLVDGDRDSRIDELAWLLRALAVGAEANLAGHDGRSGARARREQAAFG